MVEAQGFSSHPSLTDNRSLCPAPLWPLQLPRHLFQAKRAFPSFLAGCVSRAGWARAFLKCSNHPMRWRLGEEGFPCPAGCCRAHCQITLIPALKPAGASPASHCSPILRHHFSGPHPAQPLNLRRHLAVPTASPVTGPAPSGYLRLDAAGRVPAGTMAAALLPARSGRLLRSARVQAAGGNQRSWLEKIWAKAREKKSWDLARSYTSFHEKSNVAIAGLRLCWSPPRPLPGSAALPMPTQLSAESRPSLVLCLRLRRLRKPLLPLPPLPPVPRHPGSRLPLVAPVTYLLLSV